MSEKPKPKEVFLVYSGLIDQSAVQKIGQAIGLAVNDQNELIHLMLQSSGGGVGDGVCLYNIFRSLPVSLAVHNCGQVCSSAAIAYLGAPTRVVSPSGLFMLHPTHFSPQFASSDTLTRLSHVAGLEDARLEEILARHVTLSDEQKALHQIGDLWFDAQTALTMGVATEIAEFMVPKGCGPYFL